MQVNTHISLQLISLKNCNIHYFIFFVTILVKTSDTPLAAALEAPPLRVSRLPNLSANWLPAIPTNEVNINGKNHISTHRHVFNDQNISGVA